MNNDTVSIYLLMNKWTKKLAAAVETIQTVYKINITALTFERPFVCFSVVWQIVSDLLHTKNLQIWTDQINHKIAIKNNRSVASLLEMWTNLFFIVLRNISRTCILVSAKYSIKIAKRLISSRNKVFGSVKIFFDTTLLFIDHIQYRLVYCTLYILYTHTLHR